jgi:hypothetical protein
VTAAALAALDRRARNRFRDRQQVVQIERGVPARVVLAMPADADPARSITQRPEALERAPHLGLVPHDADQVLHHLLQRVLHLVRALGLAAAREGLQGPPRGFVDLPRVDRGRSADPSHMSQRARRRVCRTR